ncbi:hypothetical protein GCK32_017023 [Trichostrongylus colubriformis]|uniref:Uncharacterized protein n=1 Tax=Trichostrongylus colubriformis TaxID=6319 RepID=A0AAN8IU35_TRICO
MQFLVHSFHLVVTSRSFQQQGKGLALNLGVLEGLFPSVVHSLSADVAIKTFKGLDELLEEIRTTPPSPSRGLSIPLDEYSPVSGLFVELRQPKAPPPRFSSHNRSYKRSASAGVQFSDDTYQERSRSVERGRPLSTIQQTVLSTDNVEKSETLVTEAVKEQAVERKREKREEVTSQQESTKDSKPVEKETSSSSSRIRQPSVSRPTSKERKPVSRSTSQEKPISTSAQEEHSNTSSELLKESTTVSSFSIDRIYIKVHCCTRLRRF